MGMSNTEAQGLQPALWGALMRALLSSRAVWFWAWGSSIALHMLCLAYLGPQELKQTKTKANAIRVHLEWLPVSHGPGKPVALAYNRTSSPISNAAPEKGFEELKPSPYAQGEAEAPRGEVDPIVSETENIPLPWNPDGRPQRTLWGAPIMPSTESIALQRAYYLLQQE